MAPPRMAPRCSAGCLPALGGRRPVRRGRGPSFRQATLGVGCRRFDKTKLCRVNEAK